MNCEHSTRSTPYCPNCGKQLVVPAAQSLREHIDSNIERINQQLADQPGSPHKESRQKAGEKWCAWGAWVVQQMEKPDASE